MDPEKKQMIRNNLHTLMQTERSEPVSRQLIQKPTRSLLHLLTFHNTIPMPVIAIILALMLGTGTTYAAENTLPGDVLYPVKIHVNEEVKEALTFDPTAMENEHAQGELTAAMQARLEAYQEEYEQKMEELAVELEANGDLEAAAALRARIVTYLAHKYGILNNIGLLTETVSQNETDTDSSLSDEERKALLERRAEAMKEQQEAYQAALERRHTLLKQAQEENTHAFCNRTTRRKTNGY